MHMRDEQHVAARIGHDLLSCRALRPISMAATIAMRMKTAATAPTMAPVLSDPLLPLELLEMGLAVVLPVAIPVATHPAPT